MVLGFSLVDFAQKEVFWLVMTFFYRLKVAKNHTAYSHDLPIQFGFYELSGGQHYLPAKHMAWMVRDRL